MRWFWDVVGMAVWVARAAGKRVLVETRTVDSGAWTKCSVTNKYTGWNSWRNWAML
jgi:hypothetical protein